MDKVAIIDIGSKSIKFFVGERTKDGTISTILDTNNIAALGEGQAETVEVRVEMVVHQHLRRAGRAEHLFHAARAGQGVEVQEDQQVALRSGSGGRLRVTGRDEAFLDLRRGKEETDLPGRLRIQEEAAFPGGAAARFEEAFHGEGTADGIPVGTGVCHNPDP